MLAKKVEEILKKKEFVCVATCNFHGRPNAAPKFLLKVETNFIYLVDYVLGKTYENLKFNPRASLSIMDTSALTGYQINGMVETIETGPEYDDITKEFRKKKISFTTMRIIEGVRGGKEHNSFEEAFPEHVVIFKLKVDEVIEIGSTGNIKREKV